MNMLKLLLCVVSIAMTFKSENTSMEYIPSIQNQLRFNNKDASREIIIGGIYQHFRNKNYYKIIALATSTKDVKEKLVVYEALYDNPVSKVWVRPLEEFLELIEHDGSLVERFSYREKPQS